MPFAPRGVFTNPTSVWGAAALLDTDGSQFERVSLGLPWYNTSDYGNDIDALLAAAGVGPYVVRVNSNSVVSVNTTAGSGIYFVFEPGCKISRSGAAKLTIHSPAQIGAGARQQIFTLDVATSPVLFTRGGMIEVGWWGATGDGATNDSHAMIASYDVASAVGRTVIHHEPGTYIVTHALAVTGDGVTLQGDDAGSTIIDASAVATLDITHHAPSDTVYGLVYWDDGGGVLAGGRMTGMRLVFPVGNPGTVNQKGVWIGDVYDWNLDDSVIGASFHECVYSHAGAVNPMGRWIIHGNRFVGSAGVYSMINLNMSHTREMRVLVVNNIFDNAHYACSLSCNDFLVDGNYFFQCLDPVYIGEGAPVSIRRGKVSNNVFSECNPGGAGVDGVIRVIGGELASGGVEISDNVIADTQAGDAIQVQGSATIVDNHIFGAVGAGLYAIRLSRANDTVPVVVHLRGNVVHDTENANKWDYGIIVAANANNVHTTIYLQDNYIGDITPTTGYALSYGGADANAPVVYLAGDKLHGNLRLNGGRWVGGTPVLETGRPLFGNTAGTEGASIDNLTLTGKGVGYVIAGYGTGTVWTYTTTGTPTEVAFGTTSPVVVLDTPGTYRLTFFGTTKANAAAWSAAKVGTLRLQRTNNTPATLANATVLAYTQAASAAVIQTFSLNFQGFPTIEYTTANNNDRIALFGGLDAALETGGSFELIAAGVFAERIR